MVFEVVSVVVPVVVFVSATFLLRQFGKQPRTYLWMLIMACALFFVSWYLPSPLIYGKDTAFVTHFFGGGIFSGLLWWYLLLSMQQRPKWFMAGLQLFALVSMLGVLNELFEIVLFWLGGMSKGITDTSWDLLANTLGAFLVYIMYLLGSCFSKNDNS